MSGDIYFHCSICNFKSEFESHFLPFIKNDIGITIPDGFSYDNPKADKHICGHCVKELRRYFHVPFGNKTVII